MVPLYEPAVKVIGGNGDVSVRLFSLFFSFHSKQNNARTHTHSFFRIWERRRKRCAASRPARAAHPLFFFFFLRAVDSFSFRH